MNKTILFLILLLPQNIWGQSLLESLKTSGRSLIIPGAGEIHLGNRARGFTFLAVESALWLSYFGIRIHIRSLKEDYKIYAYRYASADFRRDDETYWSAVELNISKEEYIERLWREARSLYPYDNDLQEEYVSANMIGGSWEWQDEDIWFRFNDMRSNTRAFSSKATVVIGLIIANHLASFIDTFILTRKKETTVGLEWDVTPWGDWRFGIIRKI